MDCGSVSGGHIVGTAQAHIAAAGFKAGRFRGPKLCRDIANDGRAADGDAADGRAHIADVAQQGLQHFPVVRRAGDVSGRRGRGQLRNGGNGHEETDLSGIGGYQSG